MKRREWTAKQKLQIVLDGLKNQISVGDLCSKYSMTQGQYYKWRDQLLNNGEKAFESNPDKALVEAKKENHRLKSIIGTLTVELKKRLRPSKDLALQVRSVFHLCAAT